jgi:ABC-type Mn2+/Zn2+ transport system permease subunit
MSVFDRALLEAVLLGAACGPLGLWVLTFRQAYAAESLSHAMLPGLAIAAIVGAPLLLGAAGGIIAAAIIIAAAARDRRIGPDLAIATTITAVFGAGILLASAPEAPPRLSSLLFGDLLGVGDADLVAAALLACLTPLVLAAAHRPLTVAAHDEAAARPLGTNPARVQAGLLVLLAAAIVVAVQGLGNLLVVALLIAPAVAAQRLVASLKAQLVLAFVLGAGVGAAGVVVSDRLSLAAGASVALTAGLMALAVLALRREPEATSSARPSPIEALGGRS